MRVRAIADFAALHPGYGPEPPHPEERAAGARLEGWAASSFETHRLRDAPQDEAACRHVSEGITRRVKMIGGLHCANPPHGLRKGLAATASLYPNETL